MLEIQMIKKEIKEKLKKNELGSCLQDLEKYFKQSSIEERKILDNTIRRFRKNSLEKRMGTIPVVDFNLEENKIADIVLDLINELSEDNISHSQVFKEKIFDKILVICYNENESKKMTPFFKNHYFMNVTFDTSKVLIPKEQLRDYNYIIFDYMHRKEDPSYYELLERYLMIEDIQILYFGGERLKILEKDEYIAKVHSANSIFSLYARLKEMMEFNKYYSPEKKNIQN